MTHFPLLNRNVPLFQKFFSSTELPEITDCSPPFTLGILPPSLQTSQRPKAQLNRFHGWVVVGFDDLEALFQPERFYGSVIPYPFQAHPISKPIPCTSHFPRSHPTAPHPNPNSPIPIPHPTSQPHIPVPHPIAHIPAPNLISAPSSQAHPPPVDLSPSSQSQSHIPDPDPDPIPYGNREHPEVPPHSRSATPPASHWLGALPVRSCLSLVSDSSVPPPASHRSGALPARSCLSLVSGSAAGSDWLRRSARERPLAAGCPLSRCRSHSRCAPELSGQHRDGTAARRERC